jgi:16S rRNA (cytosine967-C5)-methyltransferase
LQHEQRLAALAVRRVFAGATLPAALAAVADDAHPRGDALVQELAYGTLRHWGRLAALTEALATKPLADLPLAALIAVAIYQLDHAHAPAFAVVDRAVDAAALMGRPRAKPLVNALLRRYLRERDILNAQVEQASPVARWSYPRWWIGRVEADHPQHWMQILAAGNERPPLTLRVNRRVTPRAALLEQFATAKIAAHAVGNAGIVVTAPRPVTELPGFTEGAFSVQDAGAQLAAPLLQAADGMRVLDACAAPGGKTTHLAELADVEITALDSDEARLARVRDNLARMHLASDRIRTVVGDAGDPSGWWDGRWFDRILADVPVHGIGHRPPPPRRKMAPAQVRYRGVRRAAAANSGRTVATARAGRFAALHDLLGLCVGKRIADHRLPGREPGRVARIHQLSTRMRARRRPTLAFGERRRPQSGRILLRPATQVRQAPIALAVSAATPPESRTDTRRHAVRLPLPRSFHHPRAAAPAMACRVAGGRRAVRAARPRRACRHRPGQIRRAADR